MKIIQKPTSLAELWESHESAFEEMMKIVVDVEKGVVGADAEMHADLEKVLLENGSRQEDLWGANLYPLRKRTDMGFLEFMALINIRPACGNKSMEIKDQKIRDRIREIVDLKLI